jgi:16S rRNA (guanine1207-N2)-methyltransferase
MPEEMEPERLHFCYHGTTMTIPELKTDIVFTTQLKQQTMTFHSTWGLFSPKAIDEGTHLLLDYVDVAQDARILDLGCGYGPIGLTLARLAPHGQTHMVDKDYVAIEFSKKNTQINRLTNVTSYLSNGFSEVPADEKFDLIVSNVPAKIGTELLQILLADAYSHLAPGGKLAIVTVSGLKEYMKRHLTSVFGNYEKLKQSKTYTAAVAQKLV